MKYIFTKLSTLTLFVLFIVISLVQPTVAGAQFGYQLYVSDIKVEKPIYNIGETVQGKFTMFNVSDISQSDIYYTISSGPYSSETLSLLAKQSPTDKIGPLYLLGKAKQIIPFSYTLPASVDGEGAIEITAMLKDGTFLAQGNVPIDIAGIATQDIAVVLGAQVLIPEVEEFISPTIGVTIYEGETASFEYVLSLTQEEHIITPTLRLYDRTDTPENLLDTIVLDPVTTKVGGDSIHTVELPTQDVAPLVYFGVLSFASDTIQVAPIGVRYIIAGPIATVRNITTESLEVTQGDTFDATVTYGGQPLDELRPERQTESQIVTLAVTAVNEKNEQVAATQMSIDLADDARSITLSLTAEQSAEKLLFFAQITDANGEVLDTYDTQLPSLDEVKDQQPLISANNKMSPLAISSLILLAMALIFLLITFKKKQQMRAPIAIIALGLALTASIFYAGDARAWEVVSSYRFENNQYLGITAVSSPLPPEVDSYDPGERINLSINYAYGDCNNEPAKFLLGIPPTNNIYLAPPETLTSTSGRYDWWNTNAKYTTREGWAGYIGSYASVNEFISQSGADYSEQLETQKLKELTEQLRTIYLEYKTNLGSVETKIITKVAYASPYGNVLAYNFSPSFTEIINNDPRVIDLKTQIYSQIPNMLGELQRYSNSKNEMLRIEWGGKDWMNDYEKQWILALFNWFSQPKISGSVKTHENLYAQGFVSRTYTLPQEPGFHEIYFYAHQDANTGVRDVTGKQTICVRGKNTTDPSKTCDEGPAQVCPFLDGNYTEEGGVISKDGVPTNLTQDETGKCTPNTCSPLAAPANLGTTCGCAAIGEVGTFQCDGSCQNPDGVTIPAECLTCDNTQVEEGACTVTQCGELVLGSYSCTQAGWQCTADEEQRTCPPVDVCSEPGIQLVPPLGTVRNANGTCTAPEQPPVVINQCSITNTAPSSYCVQLFDKDGNPTYGQSDISQTDYDLYYKNNVEGIYPIDTITEKPTTDHTIWGTASSNAGGQCIANICPVGELQKSGCFIPSVGATAQCYAQDISVQTPLQTTLTTSPDRIFDGGQCIVTWTSQGAASCTLKKTGGEQLSISLGAQAVLNVRESSVGVVLTCTAPNSETITKSATCRVFGDFSER